MHRGRDDALASISSTDSGHTTFDSVPNLCILAFMTQGLENSHRKYCSVQHAQGPVGMKVGRKVQEAQLRGHGVLGTGKGLQL